MVDQEFVSKLVTKNDSKIVMLVFDGLGGLPHPVTGKTELETAVHPNLDKLASSGVCGLSYPIAPGITPGSGPAHESLFGYDPLKYVIGRGLLDTLGIDFEFANGDLAARGNFCTLDTKGIITDRRAGRIASDKANQLCSEILNGIEIEGIKTFVLPVKEHRFSVIFRGAGLGDKLNDSDPQHEGLNAHEVKAQAADSAFAAKIVNAFILEANKRLSKEVPANGILLRGFSKMIDMPSFDEIYQLNAAAIALYPMYRGLACLVGMKVLKTGTTLQSEFVTLKEQFSNFDFFYIHIKYTDSAGEDGDFDRKVKVIEEVDGYLSVLNELKPDVVIVTGDHSTPAVMKGHSWHPVPLLINSALCRADKATQFNETQCLSGGLGHISAQSIMPIALANAGRLIKYGA